MAAPCPLLGDGVADDTLLNIAGFLPTAKDRLCLQLAAAPARLGVIGSAGDAAVYPGGGGAAVGGGVQRAGAQLGASA